MAEQTVPASLAAGIEAVPDTPGGAWQHSFPNPSMVDVAAGMLPSQPAGHVQEGPSWRITISPGKIKVWTIDEARAERRDNASPIECYSNGQARQLEGDVDSGEVIDPDDVRRDRQRLEQHSRDVDTLATWLINGEDIPEGPPSRSITEWSRRSRTRMFERLNDLDYRPLFGEHWKRNPETGEWEQEAEPDSARLPGMVTLTYSKCWQRVAPNGETVKQKHLKKLRKRYQRAFGEDLVCIWKLEFQGRKQWVWQGGELVENWCCCEWCGPLEDGRAPHIHMLMSPPLHAAKDDDRGEDEPPRYFQQWLRETWAEIVAHPDPAEYEKHRKAGTRVDYTEGLRCTDPRRVATYFLKHSDGQAKEYQHWVPAAWQEPGQGPGRFWGYWGLSPVTATEATSSKTGQRAGRLLRRYSKAQGRTKVTPTDESADGKPHEHRERVTHERRKPRAKGGVPISKYHDVIGLAGKELIHSRRITYRKTRSPAVRLKNGRGWISLNDAPELGCKLAYWLQQQQQQHQDHRDHTRAELQRCRRGNTPLTRALRLKPSSRRDALIARLRATTQSE